MHTRRRSREGVRFWVLMVGILSGACSLLGQPISPGPVTPSVPVTSVAAVVNTHVITIQAVEQFGGRAVEAARRQYMARPELFLQRRQEILRDSLEQLVERYLILDEFNSSGFNLPEGIINDVVATQIREEFGDRMTLMKTLRRVGESYEDFRNDQRDAFIITQMTLKNVNQNIFISPRKIERYYELNTNRFNVGETAKIRMIVIDKSKHARGEPMKLAEEVLAKLKTGGDFAKLADEYSDDARRNKGGDRGWIENKDSDLRSELRSFVFEAAPGSVSGIIDLDGAVFIVKVEERKSAGMRSIAEVRDEVEQMLKNMEKERLRKQWIAKLRKKSFVAYY
ncbi:MAG: peptidylprolyl isomerase [Verrucomicrobiales bacterium]|nr:peptidylprolyl isomerase [Verrucomicrobiales bacterium]